MLGSYGRQTSQITAGTSSDLLGIKILRSKKFLIKWYQCKYGISVMVSCKVEIAKVTDILKLGTMEIK